MTCSTGALIILPTSEPCKEERGFDAVAVYPILYDAKIAVRVKRRGGDKKKYSSLTLLLDMRRNLKGVLSQPYKPF